MRNTHCRMNALGAALLGLGLALGATAQTSSSNPISPKPGTAAGRMTVTSEASTDKLAGTDKAFVEKAAMGGVAEVELGKLAQQKAANDQVKQFGARMDQHDVAEFKKEAGDGRDADVKGFASKALPTLQEHLQLAQSTNDAVQKGTK